MDTSMAPAVRAAIDDALDLGDTGYATPGGYSAALRDFSPTRWGWDGLDPALTALVPDVMLGIVEAIKLVSQPGDAVVITPPVYAPFHAFVLHSGQRITRGTISRPQSRLLWPHP